MLKLIVNCVPMLFYGTYACGLDKNDKASLNVIIVVRFLRNFIKFDNRILYKNA